MLEEIAAWLRGTIPGIVILGAVGSLLAVVITRLLTLVVGRVIPLPYQLHRRKQIRQAFFLGFSAAHIDHDKTGRNLAAYLAFHMALLVISLFAFSLLVSTFSVLLAYQGNTVLTVGLFVSITAAFLCLYWAYFEFEYIYRTYLFFWKEPLRNADESYRKRESEQTGDRTPNKAMQPTPQSGAADR